MKHNDDPANLHPTPLYMLMIPKCGMSAHLPPCNHTPLFKGRFDRHLVSDRPDLHFKGTRSGSAECSDNIQCDNTSHADVFLSAME